MYNLIRFVCRCFFLLFFRLKVEGIENIPRQGGAIIAPNHVSLWDPPVIGCAMSRHIHFMAKEELFNIPLFRQIILVLKAFPVKRGAADRNAIRTAVTLLEQEKVLGLFPEGTRSRSGILGTAEPGVVMIAAKAGVPIIPAAIVGTKDIGKFPRIFPQLIVRFGNPVVLPQGKVNREQIEAYSQQIMQSIGSLLQQYRGVT
ncbi:hypothetical protein P22_2325 [Propionispora sp. 2/2-37]|uniref:lysophospholipid acyltransferase family protein n=1 Tax=Propionispora sp. 2/2-37 TaxID=1677858 RepID=UPI0006BB55A3|nr:lysophospholipid acyltransferase family protein [Propionispora sp. 2/2-37]CUH96236.1 hypothetical protein P22_2325 [Propionispora sp. 2/2-37]